MSLYFIDYCYLVQTVMYLRDLCILLLLAFMTLCYQFLVMMMVNFALITLYLDLYCDISFVYDLYLGLIM